MIQIEDEEFNVEACIQFTLLQKILIKLAKRENEMQNKIHSLEKKLRKIEENDKINESRFQIIENNMNKLAEGNTEIIRDITTTKIEKHYITEKGEKRKDSDNIQLSKTKKSDEKDNEIYYNDSDNENENENENENDNKSESYKDDIKNDYIEKDKKKKKDEINENQISNIINNDDEKNDKEDKNVIPANKDLQNEKKSNVEKKYNDDNKKYESEENDNIQISYKQNITEDNDSIKNKTNSNKNETSPELLTLLNKRIHQCEKKIEELQKGTKIHNTLSNDIYSNKNSIKDTNKEVDSLKKNISDLELKLKQSKDDMDKIKVKVQEFNIYDLIKDSGDGNLDASKLLIMNLEKKVFTKFDQVDEREKAIETDVFKCKNDVINCNNLVSSFKRDYENMKKGLGDLEKELNEHKEDASNNINDINNKIQDLYSKILDFQKKIENDEDNENKTKELINNSITDLENKIMEKINDLLKNMKSNVSKDKMKEIEDEENQLFTNLSNKINEIEKKLKLKPGNDIIDQINERLFKIEEELKKKSTKYDYEELNDRLNHLEDRNKEHSFALEGLHEGSDKFRTEMSLVVRKLEFLTGQYAKLAFNQGNADPQNKKSNLLDFTKFVEIQKFNENNKLINQKLDHLKYTIEGIQRNIDDILERLKHTPTEDDFTQFQNLLKAMLEDLRLSCSKRYADKIDVQKSFRYLETQIKSVIENNYKRNEGETWLLAKKPMSGFLCASCESYIKDLNTKNEYVAWNKYPQRDDKSYRMGHGFSRMLQLVNTDLLKNQEMKEQGKLYQSDEEKEIINLQGGKIKEIKLPIVSNQRSLNTYNNNNNNTNTNNDNNQNINNNQNIINNSQSVNIEKNNNMKLDNNDPFKDPQELMNQPRITKIIKKSRVANSSLDNSDSKINNSEYLPNLTEPNQ